MLSLFYLKIYELAVVVHDTVLSFSQEIKFIWGRKAGVVTILYLFVRYGMIIDMAFQIFVNIFAFKTVAVSNVTLRD